MQRAKKVVSNSPGLVDFAIGLENYVINLSDRQVNFFEDFKLQKNCKINLLVKTFLGLVEKMFGLVNVSFSLSEWKAVKRTFFVPCTCDRQFALTLKKESPYIVSTFNPLNMDTPLIQTLSMALSVLKIFQLKVGRPCNADATDISFFKCSKFNSSMNLDERTYFWRRSSLTSSLVHRSLRRTLARW